MNRTYYQQPYTSGGSGFRELFRGRSAFSWLFLINLGVFLILNLIRLSDFLFTDPQGSVTESPVSEAARWLAVPASLQELLYRPWTVISYMFTHEGLLHLFFNLLVLYFGGKIFMEFLGGRKLTWTYLLGGISGAVFYIAAFNIFPVFSQVVDQSVALGASASVLAVLVAVATFMPNYSVTLFFMGRVRLKYIAIILVAVDLLSIEKSNPGGHIAHLGGAFWGFVYILFLKKGTDLSAVFSRAGQWIAKVFKPRPKIRVTYSKRPLSDDEYNHQKAERQKKIDAILDKISATGYESLSREEKELLFKSSKEGF